DVSEVAYALAEVCGVSGIVFANALRLAFPHVQLGELVVAYEFFGFAGNAKSWAVEAVSTFLVLGFDVEDIAVALAQGGLSRKKVKSTLEVSGLSLNEVRRGMRALEAAGYET
ncbi:hypothetical protein D6833_08800, partial [Candidatus Parcubacteria bacterium]